MNQRTLRYLKLIAKDPETWDKKTGKPKMHHIYETLLQMKEYEYLEQVYFPAYFKFSERVKRRYHLPDSAMYWMDFSPSVGGYAIEDPDISDRIAWILERRFARLWDSDPEWLYEEIDEEEFLAATQEKPDGFQYKFI